MDFAAVTDNLNYFASKIKIIGKLNIERDKQISELFVIDGISYWDAAESVLAMHILPQVTSYKYPLFVFRINLFLKKVKASWLFKFKIWNRKKSVCFDIKSEWLLFSFSKYMTRDIFLPFMKEAKSVNYLLIENDIIIEYYDNLYETRINIFQKECDKIKSNLSLDLFVNTLVRSELLDAKSSTCLYFWMLDYFMPTYIGYHILSEQIIKNHIPQNTFFNDIGDPKSRILIELCKKYGIKSNVLQFGICAQDSIEWIFFNADRLFVWGEFFRNLLITKFSVPSNKICVSGSPRFDYLNNFSIPTNSNLKKINVLFASTYTITNYDSFYNPELLKNFKDSIIDLFSNCDNVILTIKPHPLEPDNSFKIDKKNVNVILSDKSKDIRELISDCDILITLGSTSTFDALLQNKIVLSPVLDGLMWWDDIIVDNNLSDKFYSFEQLKSYIKSLNRDVFHNLVADKNNLVSDFVYRTDISASKFILREILHNV